MFWQNAPTASREIAKPSMYTMYIKRSKTFLYEKITFPCENTSLCNKLKDFDYKVEFGDK